MKTILLTVIALKLATVLASANLMIGGLVVPSSFPINSGEQASFSLTGNVPENFYSVSVQYTDNSWTEPHVNFSMDLSLRSEEKITVRNQGAPLGIIDVALVPQSEYASFQVGKSIRPLVVPPPNTEFQVDWIANNVPGSGNNFRQADFGDPTGATSVADSGTTLALLFGACCGLLGFKRRKLKSV